MQTIEVLNENVIKALSSIKEENVSIADVVISRKTLLSALKLQTQPSSDMLTLTYGRISWKDTAQDVDNEPCIQFNCNHTTMRFLNRPLMKNAYRGIEPKVMPLNFVDYRADTVEQKLTGIPIDIEQLIEALNFVMHGVATEASRPVLECVCFDCDKGKLTLITADGFRLPVATMKVKGMAKKQVLIQRSDIPKLLAFLRSSYVGKGKNRTWHTTYIDIGKSKTTFMTDKGRVELDNQDGTYPNYSQLVPTMGTHIELIASDMLESVKALNAIAKDGSGIIRLKFDKGFPCGKLTLSAKSEEVGESAIECDAKVERDCYIAVNAKYLIDFLKVCKGNIIDLFLTNPSSPMVIYKNSEQFEVVMPMFVQW